MRRSCRIAAERECVLSVTLVVTLGSLPVIALFKSANGQMPSSMRIEDAIGYGAVYESPFYRR